MLVLGVIQSKIMKISNEAVWIVLQRVKSNLLFDSISQFLLIDKLEEKLSFMCMEISLI